MEESHLIDWNENEISPLFDPKELGKSQRDCQLCSAIAKIFEAKKGTNEGLILFSHNVPDLESFKIFLTPFFKNPRIKKLFYLELDVDSYLSSKNIALNLSKLKNLQIKRLNNPEFSILLDKNQFEQGILYEIVKYSP